MANQHESGLYIFGRSIVQFLFDIRTAVCRSIHREVCGVLP